MVDANQGSDPARAGGPPGAVVLVLQGGGALGAYQVGVYQAMHEAGIEPDWVIGTSIGAINAAIIAGNPPDRRMERLEQFWETVEWRSPVGDLPIRADWFNPWATWAMMTQGVAGFFSPNPASWWGLQNRTGLEQAAFYTTAPLRETLGGLIDFDQVQRGGIRLTVGAVNVRTGAMRYFDSRSEPLRVDHVMASGALPPAFPAVRIDGEAYWDGGIYSNTPIEAVLDDNPRRSSTIFTVHLWSPGGAEPSSIWETLGRQKDIQYASRATSHLAKQKQIHRLRHVISELADHLPQDMRQSQEIRELASWGCRTTMHVVRLCAPRLMNEDHTKDVDFTMSGIHARWKAGYIDAKDAIAQAPWAREVDPHEGVLVHEHESKLPAVG
jgi:NTE family protein